MILGFTGTVIIGRTQDGTRLLSSDVIRLPVRAALELKGAAGAVVCCLDLDPVKSPYGVFVPQRICKWSSF